MIFLRNFSTDGCFAPFDTDKNRELSSREFSELCYKLFVGTNDGKQYDFDPDAIFKRITLDSDKDAGIKCPEVISQ